MSSAAGLSAAPEEAQRPAKALQEFDESCLAVLASDGVFEFKRSRTMQVSWPVRSNLTPLDVVGKLHAVIKQLLGRPCSFAEVIPAVRRVGRSKLEIACTKQEIILQLLAKPLVVKGHSLRLSSIAVPNLRKVFIKGIPAKFPFSVIAKNLGEYGAIITNKQIKNFLRKFFFV